MLPFPLLNHSPTPSGLIDSALKVSELPLRVHPLIEKRPVLRDWPDRASNNPEQIVNWLHGGKSYGVVCDEIAVIDTDSRDLAVWWFKNMPETPWMVKTPSGGVHFFYRSVPGLRNAVKVDRGWDVRAGGRGSVVGFGSEIHGKRYELIGEATLDLPPFDPEWLPKKLMQRSAVIQPRTPQGVIRDVRRYIRAISSIEGQDGSGACFRVACILRDEGYSFDEALLEMITWNEVCADPVWTVDALSKKLRDAFAHSLKGG